MSERLTAAKAAEALGVHVNTIKNWLGQLPIPVEKDSAGRWRFDDRAFEVLQAIKELRDEDRTFDTIRRRIDSGELSEPQDTTSEATAPHNPSMAETLAAAITPQLVEALSAQTALAEKYAHAAHQIGKLEAENEYLRNQVAELRDKVALLEAPKPEPQRPWWKLW